MGMMGIFLIMGNAGFISSAIVSGNFRMFQELGHEVQGWLEDRIRGLHS